jgi:hypothetical protein
MIISMIREDKLARMAGYPTQTGRGMVNMDRLIHLHTCVPTPTSSLRLASNLQSHPMQSTRAQQHCTGRYR